MSALGRMVRAGRQEGRILDDALEGLANVFGRPRAAARLGRHFNCAEADRIAWVLCVSNHGDAAAIWLQGHAVSDSPQDLHGGPAFDAMDYIAGREPDTTRAAG